MKIKSTKHLYRGGLTAILSLIFVSCSNFLNSGNLKIELDKAIEYANSKSFDIRFSGANGKISPNGIKSYKASDTDVLIFNEDLDWCFTEWQVFENGKLLDDESVDQLIEFDDKKNPETKIKILQRIEGLAIKACCEKRPCVLNYSPSLSTEGAFIDSTIRIFFNQAMSPNSIYWTKDELAEIGVTEELFDISKAENDGEEIKDDDGNNLYYAYQEKSAPETRQFKNITIQKRAVGTNLLANFGCPFFERDDFYVLNIPVNKSNLPPSVTDIEFSISKEFANSNDIQLSASYSNFYYTNVEEDSESPKIYDLTVTDLNNPSKKYFDKSDVSIDFGENLLSLNIAPKNLSINVKGKVSDVGSKPAKLEAELKPVSSKFYKQDKSIYLEPVRFAGNIAICDFSENGYDFDFGSGIPDGIYDIVISAVDNNGNKAKESYRIVYDHTAPASVSNVYSGGRLNKKVYLYFDTPSDDDLDHVELYRLSGANYIQESFTVKKVDGANSYLTEINQKSKHYEIRPNADADTNSYYKVCTVDYTGHKTEYEVQAGYAQEGMIVYQNNRGTTKEEIFASNNYYGEKNPIGILYAIKADVYAGRYANLVYDLKEYSGNDYVWGVYGKRPNGEDTEPHYDGLKYYNKFITDFSSTCLVTVNAYFPSTGNHANRPTVWTLLKDTINKNNSLTWYLPACDDFKIICNKKNALNKGVSILNGKVSVTLQGDNYLGTSSLYSVNQMYRIKKGCVTSGNWDYTSDNSEKDRAGICNWHFVTEINLD